jgi:hypothetical protein
LLQAGSAEAVSLLLAEHGCVDPEPLLRHVKCWGRLTVLPGYE